MSAHIKRDKEKYMEVSEKRREASKKALESRWGKKDEERGEKNTTISSDTSDDNNKSGKEVNVPEYAKEGGISQSGKEVNVPQYAREGNIYVSGKEVNVPQYTREGNIYASGKVEDTSPQGNGFDISDYVDLEKILPYGRDEIREKLEKELRQREETKKAKAQSAEKPRFEMPRAEMPRAEMPRAEMPRAEMPRAEMQNTEDLYSLMQNTEALRVDEQDSERENTPFADNNTDNNKKYGTEEKFEEFWLSYPKKTNKEYTKKVFYHLNPDNVLQGKILSSINDWKATTEWKRENGRFIPYPAKWLEDKRWEDEIELTTEEKWDRDGKKYGFGCDSFDTYEFVNAAFQKATKDYNLQYTS